ncbi:MAG: DUF3662 domain-containing protein [Anaerolineaceae bacterium]|nr:DUF3662 domain-containing protein [Anaerolineaceae bacterium]
MRSRLDRIEARLQALIESSTALLPRENIQQILAKRLVAALQASLIQKEEGKFVAPSLFIIHLNPLNLSEWQTQQDLLDKLTLVLQEMSFEEEFEFDIQPIITLEGDSSLPADDFFITTEFILSQRGATEAIQLNASMESPTQPLSAFLIVNGSEVIPLRQSVINIGRRLDNHIVIPDPRVSRSHAQLRSSRGNYIVFDLNSTGGTFVNGLRTTQQTLKAGDVISLAGVPIIYGEEASAKAGDTSELNPESFPDMEDEKQDHHDSQ